MAKPQAAILPAHIGLWLGSLEFCGLLLTLCENAVTSSVTLSQSDRNMGLNVWHVCSGRWKSYPFDVLDCAIKWLFMASNRSPGICCQATTIPLQNTNVCVWVGKRGKLSRHSPCLDGVYTAYCDSLCLTTYSSD